MEPKNLTLCSVCNDPDVAEIVSSSLGLCAEVVAS